MQPNTTLYQTEEVWVASLEGYEVSSLGNVRKIGSKTNLRLLIHDALPYFRVSMGKHLSRYVHRLVCEAFHGPAPEGKPHAAHENGDSRDNRPTNLSWKTPKENMDDRERHGRTSNGVGHRLVLAKAKGDMNPEKVAEIRSRAVTGETYKSIADDFGISGEQVRRIATGERWGWVPGAVELPSRNPPAKSSAPSSKPFNVGSRNGLAKLDEAKALEIKQSSESAASLSERFQVSKTTIYLVKQGRAWKHV